NDIQEALHLISKLAEFNEGKELTKIVDCGEYLVKTKHKKEVEEYVYKDRIEILPDNLTIQILKEFKIDMPEQMVVSNLEQGIDFASTIFPVAIKATAQDLAHKTDFKGIFLDIRTITEFEEKYNELKENITKTTGNVAPLILI